MPVPPRKLNRQAVAGPCLDQSDHYDDHGKCHRTEEDVEPVEDSDDNQRTAVRPTGQRQS